MISKLEGILVGVMILKALAKYLLHPPTFQVLV